MRRLSDIPNEEPYGGHLHADTPIVTLDELRGGGAGAGGGVGGAGVGGRDGAGVEEDAEAVDACCCWIVAGYRPKIAD